ncbi:MAG TPA: ABC transporter substrate-binding protein [Candidatus Acidoferrales bacterium]|nr:ABC transporter substrate-binding protein [Candidatus Acidoferrales bacterium]
MYSFSPIRKYLGTFLFFLLLHPVLLPAAERARFAYPSKSLNYLPLFFGKDKGIYQAEGIDLELIQVSAPIAAKALLTHDLDFSGAVIMSGAAAGMPVKVIGFITVKPSFWLVTQPQIHSIGELKNKTIGISGVGSASDLLARYLLKRNGLIPDKEVALLSTGATANNLTALKAGSIDGGILSPPFHAMAKVMGFNLLVYLGDYVDQSLSGMVTTEKNLREKPDMVKRVLRGTLKSLRYVRSNPAETTRYIATGWRVDPALAEELYRSMLLAYSLDGSMGEKGIRDMMDREMERMGIKEEVPISRVVDLRLLREVQKEN